MPRGFSWTKLSSCSTVAGGTSSPYWIATPPCSRLWTSCAWLTRLVVRAPDHRHLVVRAARGRVGVPLVRRAVGRRDRVNPPDRGRGWTACSPRTSSAARASPGPSSPPFASASATPATTTTADAGSSGDGEESAIGPLRRAGMLRLPVRARLRRHGRGTIPTATSGPSDVRATVPRPHDDRIADHRSRRPRRGRGRCLARGPRPTSGVGRGERESPRPRTGDARPRTPRDRGRGAARRRARHARRAGARTPSRRPRRRPTRRECAAGRARQGTVRDDGGAAQRVAQADQSAGRGGRPCARAVLRRRHAAAQRSQRPHVDPRHGVAVASRARALGGDAAEACRRARRDAPVLRLRGAGHGDDRGRAAAPRSRRTAARRQAGRRRRQGAAHGVPGCDRGEGRRRPGAEARATTPARCATTSGS